MPSPHKTVRELLAAADEPLPPTADHTNVQRGLLRVLNGINAADHIVTEYQAPAPQPATD